MQNEIALIESKTFWSAVLAVVAIVAQQFHWSWIYGWSSDPNTPTTILNFIVFASAIAAGLFRTTATAKVTSFISTKPGATDAHTYGHAWLALIPLLMALGGCNTLSMIAGASVNPNYAYALVETFNGFETSADGYLRLAPCVSGGSAVCRNPAAVKAIVAAVRTGRTARNAVVAALHSTNGAAIPVASYDTLSAAVRTLQSAYANYQIALPSKGN